MHRRERCSFQKSKNKRESKLRLDAWSQDPLKRRSNKTYICNNLHHGCQQERYQSTSSSPKRWKKDQKIRSRRPPWRSPLPSKETLVTRSLITCRKMWRHCRTLLELVGIHHHIWHAKNIIILLRFSRYVRVQVIVAVMPYTSRTLRRLDRNLKEG